MNVHSPVPPDTGNRKNTIPSGDGWVNNSGDHFVSFSLSRPTEAVRNQSRIATGDNPSPARASWALASHTVSSGVPHIDGN